MNLKMSRLQIIALKTDLQQVIRVLRELGCVHIDDQKGAPESDVRPLAIDRTVVNTQEKIRLLLTQVEGLLNTLGGETAVETTHRPDDFVADTESGVAALMPRVQVLTNQRKELQAELDSLPRYQATLDKLLPVVPPSVHAPGNASVALLVSRAYSDVLDMISKHMTELTGGKADMVSRDIDDTTRAMLLVFPAAFAGEVDSLLGREDVSRLRLPTGLGDGPPDVVMRALRQRLATIPEEIDTINKELAVLADHWREPLTIWREGLRDELEAYTVSANFGETDSTFVVMGWVPSRDLERVKQSLHTEIGATVLVFEPPITPEMQGRAPIALENPAPVRPFQSLVKIQSLPRYGDIDPSLLMALFMPFFFGMMLGDIGYGALLLLLTFGLLRRFKTGIFHDILSILFIGAGWAVVFGIVFGELFGTLGEELGLHPLLFDRASPEHVSGLLVMTIGVGAAHITLGVILGVWEAWKHRDRSHLMERGGMLLGLVGLFLLVGVLAEFLPEVLRTPAIGGLILGIVVMSASKGMLGILMGPIEFIGVIGNTMSYLRIAAIGLASVYLAKVGNDMAGLVGNLVVGVIIATLVHALNLVLGAFSPTIHSLRLHYVEFFRKFYEGGGRPYEPFTSRLKSQ